MDIVERLRAPEVAWNSYVPKKAADEIVKLRDLLEEAYADADEVLRPRIKYLETQLAECQQQRDELVEAVKAALSDDQPYISKCKDALAKVGADKTGEVEHDLNRCPSCGGPADNGFSREIPPSPYYCTKCMEKLK